MTRLHVALLVVLTTGSPAVAQPRLARIAPEPQASAPPVEQQFGKAVELVVDGHGGSFDIPTHAEVLTSLQFSADIQSCTGYNDRLFFFERLKRQINVHPLRRAGRDAHKGTVQCIVGTDKPFTVSLVLAIVDTPDKAMDMAWIRHRREVEVIRATVDSEVERRMVTEKAVVQQQTLQQSQALLAGQLLDHAELLAIEHGSERNQGGVSMAITQAFRIGKDVHLIIQFHNHGMATYGMATVGMFGPDRAANLAGYVHMEPPTDAGPGMLARIPGKKSMRGVVVVRDVERVMDQPLSMMITELGGGRPMWLTNIRLAPMLAPPPDADRASLYVQPSIGLMLLPEALAPGQQDATFLQGLSLRFLFALMGWSRFAFEGELAGVQANDARFSGVTFEGRTGELERHATLIRAMAGIRLRFGKRLMPTLHLNTGLMAAFVSSQLHLADGTYAKGPDGFGLGWGFGLGLGLDYRLSKDWVLGGKLSVVNVNNGMGEQLNQGAGTFEVGVHLGYSWDVVRDYSQD